jgi:hypothetical protein
MRILEVTPKPNWILTIVLDNGCIGEFDIAPYLQYEAFRDLQTVSEFMKISNGGYFVEWSCGADLSVDTIHAHLKITGTVLKTSLV